MPQRGVGMSGSRAQVSLAGSYTSLIVNRMLPSKAIRLSDFSIHDFKTIAQQMCKNSIFLLNTEYSMFSLKDSNLITILIKIQVTA